MMKIREPNVKGRLTKCIQDCKLLGAQHLKQEELSTASAVNEEIL